MLRLDMFLRSTNRKKDGKDHRYFSIVENRRLAGGKSVQRTVLYLGEINDQQQAAWRKRLEVFDEQERRYTTMSLFPEDREIPADALDSVQVRLSGLELRRPRIFGNCWLACELWYQLGLDEFWQERFPEGREGLQPGRKTGLLAVGDRPSGDAGWVSTGLRSDEWQYRRLHYPAGISAAHQDHLWPGAAGVGDGSGHSHRGGFARDAGARSP